MEDEYSYLQILKQLISEPFYPNRTKEKTSKIFGVNLRFSLLNHTLPVLTTKKVFLKGVIRELLWFLKGSTNTKYLIENNVHIWDKNTIESNGETGPIYGWQWRNWGGDQLQKVINSLKNDPFSRRHVVSAWNVEDVGKMCLPPCHMMYIFCVTEILNVKYLNCHVIMRSCDMFLGCPFNITSYAILTHMIAKLVGMEPGSLMLSITDAHLYENHLEAAKEQVSRKPEKSFPVLKFKKESYSSIDEFDFDDFIISGYVNQGVLKGDMVT